ncbi:TolC family outer membrane protein [Agrobacterium sp. DKPNP3]|uniref:TolC family outer membrane protein n=1 Tax=Agrobacterium sp. DKPNP3 TaxID=3457323 RepID=UPI00404458D4
MTGSTAGPATSQTPESAEHKRPLSLETAVRKAVDWHPAVTETIGRLRQQTESVNEARAGYLPNLSWGLDSSYSTDRSDRYSPDLNFNVSQMLYDFGKVDNRVKIATAGIAGRKSQVLMAVDDLAREAAYSVIEIQRNRSLRGVARDQIKDTKAILELVKSRTDKGASTRSDLLQAEARVQAAEATLLEIEGQLSRWESVLANLSGIAGRIEVSDTIPAWLSKACGAREMDWSRVPVVMHAAADREAAAAQIDLAKAEGLPTLSLDAGIGVDVTEMSSFDPDYSVGLRVTGSLYNGGATSARRNMAVQALGASQAAEARARVDILRNLTEASSQISSKESLRRSLSMRQSTMRQTRDLYRTQYVELGTRSLLDLLNADQELHAARFDISNIQYDLHRLSIDCTFNAGRMREAFALEGQTVQGISL